MTIVSLYKEINLPFNSDGNLKEYIVKPSFRKKKTYTMSYWFYIGYAYRSDVLNS